MDALTTTADCGIMFVMNGTFKVILPVIAVIIAGCATEPINTRRAVYSAPDTANTSRMPATNQVQKSEVALPKMAAADAARLLDRGAWLQDGVKYDWIPASYVTKPGSTTIWAGSAWSVAPGCGYGYGDCWSGRRWP